jgi:Metal-dependent hydrolases of the beta-lactamase superfamily III
MLHMTPSTIATIAKEAKVKKVVLSHIMRRTENKKAQKSKDYERYL